VNAQPSTFALDVRRWCEQAKENADAVLRATSLELLTRVVLRSPVGNADLWKSNDSARYKRETFNLFAERLNQRATIYNANLAAAGEVTKSGRIRGARSIVKLKSDRALKRAYPNPQGKGYVGGRFRGNWQVTVGSPASGEVRRVDAAGTQTIEAGAAAIAPAVVGPTIYLTNNVPYAIPLEYGHSKQAPTGVVRVTAVEFQAIVDEQVRALPQ
jgi:hypothetical protein